MLLSQEIRDSSGEGEMSWSSSDGFRSHSHYNIQPQNPFRTDAEKKYVCNQCGKAYKATTSLSRHIRLECNVVPAEICPLCNRRFRHKFVLNSHIVGCQRKLNHILRKKDN